MTRKSEDKYGTSSHSRTKYPQWHNLISGAVAGGGARFLTAPLDLIKIRRQIENCPSNLSSKVTYNTGMFQSIKTIVKNEGGVKALFRGNVAATCLWVGYAAVQFSMYSRCHDFMLSYSTKSGVFADVENDTRTQLSKLFQPPKRAVQICLETVSSNPTSIAFASGATAGVFGTLATYPFDVCRSAFAAQGLPGKVTSSSAASMRNEVGARILLNPPKSIASFYRSMVHRHGIRGMFSGISPAVAQIVPYMGINFALYDLYLRYDDKLNVGSSGIAGALAGGVSKFIVYPLDTVKKRMQAQTFFTTFTSSSVGPATSVVSVRYKGMVDCIVKIARDEGMPSFYKGLAPSVIKSMAATGFSFALFSTTKNFLESVHDSQIKD
mmetsp:Transcript_20650/g.25356  ORF Transcript_20650/g.25356 Transcript_20650/m.25356 type:complete len:381 (+) Transcript_20650:47-1189(+)